MPVIVKIRNADVYYQPTNGTASTSHQFFALPGAPDPAAIMFQPIPTTTFQLSAKHNQQGEACEWLFLTEDQFVRFKNGGKRLPSSGKTLTEGGGTTYSRDRSDRETSPVLEGDVGPYKKGDGNLYKANLTPANTSKPSSWSLGSAGTPDYYETDPAPHVQKRQNRDHQNNQLSLLARGADPADGTAITIPQWIHMNGYTFGAKAKKPKNRNPDFAGQTRSQWIAAHASEALFKEMYQTLRFYNDSKNLTMEIVGSYRYLYKLNVKQMGYTPTAELDNLIMHYLGLAQ